MNLNEQTLTKLQAGDMIRVVSIGRHTTDLVVGLEKPVYDRRSSLNLYGWFIPKDSCYGQPIQHDKGYFEDLILERLS